MTEQKIAIVVDSTTALPEGMLEGVEIKSAPAIIIWEGDELRDGVDIQPEAFYKRLAISQQSPGTSQATPTMFREIFEDLLAKGYQILAVTISSKLSGMYESAVIAKEMLNNAKIEVVDSFTGSMAVGLALTKTFEAVKSGATLKKCRQVLENALKHTGIFLSVDTLEYLHRGGRIGGAQKFLATALKFKPILEVADGEFQGLERVRTRAKSLDRLVELTVERVGDLKPAYIAALHANAKEVAEELLQKINEKIDTAYTIIAEVSPGVGVHLGPGTVGIAYMAGTE